MFGVHFSDKGVLLFDGFTEFGGLILLVCAEFHSAERLDVLVQFAVFRPFKFNEGQEVAYLIVDIAIIAGGSVDLDLSASGDQLLVDMRDS
jgi:hypothetical protein